MLSQALATLNYHSFLSYLKEEFTAKAKDEYEDLPK